MVDEDPRPDPSKSFTRSSNLYILEGVINVPLLFASMVFMKRQHGGVQAWWALVPLVLTQCRATFGICSILSCFSTSGSQLDGDYLGRQVVAWLLPFSSAFLVVWYFLGIIAMQLLGAVTVMLSVLVTWLISVNIFLCVVSLTALSSVRKQGQQREARATLQVQELERDRRSGDALESGFAEAEGVGSSPSELPLATAPPSLGLRDYQLMMRHPMRKLSELTLRSYAYCGPADVQQCVKCSVPAIDEDQGPPKCIICLTEYQPGEVLRELYCGHSFHAMCFERWMIHGTPLARCPLRCVPPNLGVEPTTSASSSVMTRSQVARSDASPVALAAPLPAEAAASGHLELRASAAAAISDIGSRLSEAASHPRMPSSSAMVADGIRVAERVSPGPVVAL